MASKRKILGRIHDIHEITRGHNLLAEGANPVSNEDGTFSIRNVTIIKAGLSENGNFYPAKVLEKAVPLFKGTQVRTDHETFLKQASVRDVVGVIEKSWYNAQDKVIKAHIKFSSTAEDLVTRVREGIIGDLSINARGKTMIEQVGDRIQRNVEELLKVFSVDMVCEAAAGGTLQEEHRHNSLSCERMRRQMEELKNLTEEELRAARPDLVESIEKKKADEASAALKEAAEKGSQTETTSSVSKEDLGSVVKEQINAIFKERDDKMKIDTDASALEESIVNAVDKVLKESDVDDTVKVFVRESLIPFARESFKEIGEIDEKKLSEERDAVLEKFTQLAGKLTGKSVAAGGGTPQGGYKKGSHLIDYLP